MTADCSKRRAFYVILEGTAYWVWVGENFVPSSGEAVLGMILDGEVTPILSRHRPWLYMFCESVLATLVALLTSCNGFLET